MLREGVVLGTQSEQRGFPLESRVFLNSVFLLRRL